MYLLTISKLKDSLQWGNPLEMDETGFFQDYFSGKYEVK